jgi:glycosyltransferase involved in cell wall biosynthesis
MGDIGIVALLPDAWGSGPWMGRHQILTRLSRYFHVVWVDPALYWREFMSKRRTRETAAPFSTEVGEGFSVFRPGFWLPKLYRPRALAEFTSRQALKMARRKLERRGCGKILLHVWRPEYAYALDLFPWASTCYYIADEYSFSPVEQALDDAECDLIARVDNVVVHSLELMNKKGHINPNTLFIPNGVDFDAFSLLTTEPSDLEAIPHPRIGYVGTVKQQLMLDLMARLADKHKTWSCVFLGPYRSLGDQAAAVERLAAMPNVHFLGPRPVSALPGYVQHFDVCTMCYQIDGYTKFIYPLKLHEYLASGRPVVSSPIASLSEFAHVVTLAETEPQWSEALSASLDPSMSSPERIAARQAVAKQHDWNALVSRIAEMLCLRLGTAYLERWRELDRGRSGASRWTAQ